MKELEVGFGSGQERESEMVDVRLELESGYSFSQHVIEGLGTTIVTKTLSNDIKLEESDEKDEIIPLSPNSLILGY